MTAVLLPCSPPSHRIRASFSVTRWLGPRSRPVRTPTSLTPAGQPVPGDESPYFPSVHPVDLRRGHMEGVTKPEQAGRANGVHTEVFVGRQDPLPVGGFVLPGNYPGARLFRPSLARPVAHGRRAYDVFLGLGHVERVTFSTQGSCPGAFSAPRRCTYTGVPYRTPTALLRSGPMCPLTGRRA